MSEGQDLLDVANSAWNDRRAEYSGPYYRQAVAKAMAQTVDEDGKRKKRRMRREEAASTVAHIFDTARQSDAERLQAVATNVAEEDTSEGTELHTFATDVANSMHTTEQGTFGFIDIVALLPVIMSLISTVVPLFQSCKKPTPVPAT